MSKTKFKFYTERYKAQMGILSDFLNAPDNSYVQEILLRNPAPTNIVEEMSLDDMIVSLARDLRSLSSIDPQEIKEKDNAMRYELLERRIEKIKELSQNQLNEERKNGEISKARYTEYKYLSSFMELYDCFQTKLDNLDYQYSPEEETADAFREIDNYIKFQPFFIRSIEKFNGFVNSEFYDEAALPEEIRSLLKNGCSAEAVLESGNMDELAELVVKFLNDGVTQIDNVTSERTEAMQNIRNKRNTAIIEENERYEKAVAREAERHTQAKSKIEKQLEGLDELAENLEKETPDPEEKAEWEGRVATLFESMENLKGARENEAIWYEQNQEELARDHARRMEQIQSYQGGNQNEIEDVINEIINPLKAMLQVLRPYAVYLDELFKASNIVFQNAQKVGAAQNLVYDRQNDFKEKITNDKNSAVSSLDKFDKDIFEWFINKDQLFDMKEKIQQKFDEEIHRIDNTGAGSFEIKTYAEQILTERCENVPDTYIVEEEEIPEAEQIGDVTENSEKLAGQSETTVEESEKLSEESENSKRDPIYDTLRALCHGLSIRIEEVVDECLLKPSGYDLKALTRALAAVSLALVLKVENSRYSQQLDNKAIADRLISIYETLSSIKGYAADMFYGRMDSSEFLKVIRNKEFYLQINNDLAMLSKKKPDSTGGGIHVEQVPEEIIAEKSPRL